MSAQMYVITGTDYHGRRFRAIHTSTPQHYNIYNGTVWKVLENNKRKRVYTVTN